MITNNYWGVNNLTLSSPFYGIRTNASDTLGSRSSLAESERWAKCDSDPTNELFYFFMKLKISSPFNLLMQTSLAWKKTLLGFVSLRVFLSCSNAMSLPRGLLISSRGMLSPPKDFFVLMDLLTDGAQYFIFLVCIFKRLYSTNLNFF